MSNDNPRRTRRRTRTANPDYETTERSEAVEAVEAVEAAEPPSRARSDAQQTADRATSEGIGGGDPRDPNKGTRPPRVPMNKGMNLAVAYPFDKSKYHYRWITEKSHRPGGLAAAKGAYYEHCTDHEGNVISRPTGSSITYLMRLPLEYWQEDLATKRAAVQRTLEEQTKLGPKEYAPTKTNREGGESSIVERSTTSNPYAE